MTLSLIVSRCVWFMLIPTAALSMAAFAPPEDAAKPPEATGNPSPSAAASKGDAAKKYCIFTRPTGTRMDRKTCRTKEGWAREGVDIEKVQVVE